MINVFLLYLPSILLTVVSVLFAKRFLSGNGDFMRFLSLVFLGISLSSFVFGAFGIIFGFVPVVLNAFMTTLLLKDKKV